MPALYAMNAHEHMHKYGTMAGVAPKDVQVAEVYDVFTIGEILHTEYLGFCPLGEGGRFLEEGHTQITGNVAVNPSGGLQSRGIRWV